MQETITYMRARIWAYTTFSLGAGVGYGFGSKQASVAIIVVSMGLLGGSVLLKLTKIWERLGDLWKMVTPPKTQMISYREMTKLLGTKEYYRAWRMGWPEGEYLWNSNWAFLRHRTAKGDHNYFSTEEDTRMCDWFVARA